MTPIGNTAPEYCEGLKNGVSGCDFITKFDAEKFRTRIACELKNFDVTQFIPRQDARKMDQFTQYGVVASDEAIKDSGLDLEAIDKNKVGVIWGSGIGGLKTFAEVNRRCNRGEALGADLLTSGPANIRINPGRKNKFVCSVGVDLILR